MMKNPVLLVHGIYDTIAKFNIMSAYLTQRGWEVHRINLTPNIGSAKLEQLATQVADYIDKTFPTSQVIDLLGFSMGGLVTRYYLQRLGGIKRVQRYISISAPNNGTLMAYSLPLPGIIQMRPNSQFLADLNRDRVEILSQINCTLFWTPYDLMILPPTSSKIGIGREIILPVLVHAWMVNDLRTLEQVVQVLSEPL
jgi:triacylglycerol lipase